MAFDYERAASTALSLITRFGQAATINRDSFSGGNAWDKSSGSTTTADTTVRCAVVDYADNEIDGTLIKRNDKRVYVAASGLAITLALSDRITIGGVSHAIIGMKTLAPAGIVIFYELQARA